MEERGEKSLLKKIFRVEKIFPAKTAAVWEVLSEGRKRPFQEGTWNVILEITLKLLWKDFFVFCYKAHT